MDDITSRISDMLADPATVERLQGLASQIMGNDGSADLSKLGSMLGVQQPAPPKDEGGLSPEQMGKIMKVVGALNSSKPDSRALLLSALRPYLSSERQQRLDTAVKLLKIAALLPMITESGLLNL
jgi:hypothetical protein